MKVRNCSQAHLAGLTGLLVLLLMSGLSAETKIVHMKSKTFPNPIVWDSNYTMVQHMKDTTTSSITDSTSNNNDGTKKAANEPLQNTTGKINSAQYFDGNDDYVNISDSASLDLGCRSGAPPVAQVGCAQRCAKHDQRADNARHNRGECFVR